MFTKPKIIVFSLMVLLHLIFAGEVNATITDVIVNYLTESNIQVNWKDSNANDSNIYMVRFKECKTEDNDYKYQFQDKSPVIISNVLPKSCLQISVKSMLKCQKCNCPNNAWTPIVQPTPPPEPCKPCEPPFVEIGGISGSCYYFGNSNTSWYRAQSECQKRGSNLAIVDTAQKNNAFKKYLEKDDSTATGFKFYWLDGHHQKSEGVWRWKSTGAEFGFTDWNVAMKEPSEAHQENCLYFWPTDKPNSWLDSLCFISWAAPVCEMKQLSNCI